MSIPNPKFADANTTGWDIGCSWTGSPSAATSINLAFAALPRARGFDTSRHNHRNDEPIDFQAAYDAGFRLWAGRLSVGNYYIDPWIERDFAAASLTPLIKIVYHVIKAGLDTTSQINKMLTGFRLLKRKPDGLVFDVETDGDLGAEAVTRSLREHVLLTRYDGRKLLYSNDNYLRNYIKDTFGLDIWLADPDNNDDLTLYNPVIVQSSWATAIPGVPDPTTDYDEFMGDEIQLYQYFNAFEPPDPEPTPTPEPEDDMTIKERLKILAEELAEIIADIPDVTPPVPPTPPPPVPPVETVQMRVKVEKAKVWCFEVWNETQRKLVEKRNASDKPIMQEYISQAGKRLLYYLDDHLTFKPGLVDADSSADYMELANIKGDKGQRLFVDRAQLGKLG